MEAKCSCSCGGFEFGFAFNDINFSDRVLRIEIMTDPVYAPPSPDSVAAAMAENRVPRGGKRRRRENVEEIPSGDANWTIDCSADAEAVRVTTLHISSPILASKSPFFYKLLSNGMKESQQKQVTLKINASEEASLMELLNFIYTNTLNITEAPALVDLLIFADKFGVTSCMRYCCSQLLLNSPMTTNSAFLYLDLPQTVTTADVVQPLIDAANQYLASRFKDLKKFEEEVMALPLSVIEAILASDDLQVESEDDVYDFALKWARQHYDSRPEERRQVLSTRLARLIRFPYMTSRKLEEILTCDDFEHNGDTSKLILAALIFKTRPLQSSPSEYRFVERAYKLRLVKVVELELPQPQCMVYLDLKREQLAALFPSGGNVYFQTFLLGGHEFFLFAQCAMDQRRSSHYFGLYFGMQRKSSHSSESLVVDYDFAAKSRITQEFVTKFRGYDTITPGGEAYGCGNLFKVPWTFLMGEGSLYFINGVLHLRAQLTIRH